MQRSSMRTPLCARRFVGLMLEDGGMRSALTGGLLLRLLPALETAAANDTDTAVTSLQPGDLLVNATRPCCCCPAVSALDFKTHQVQLHSQPFLRCWCALSCPGELYLAQVSFKECNHGCPASLRFQHCTNCRVQWR